MTFDYRGRNWLLEKKIESIKNGKGLQYIADLCGCSYHTIRKWLKVYNLQYTKKEVAEYTQIWNKGLPKEDQPRFGKVVDPDVRLKMRLSARCGEESEFWRGGVDRGQYSPRDFSFKYKNYIIKKFGNKCNSCSATDKFLEIDHVMPVWSHPELGLDLDNLQPLCVDCHRTKSKKEHKEYFENLRVTEEDKVE